MAKVCRWKILGDVGDGREGGGGGGRGAGENEEGKSEKKKVMRI